MDRGRARTPLSAVGGAAGLAYKEATHPRTRSWSLRQR